ncbi:MAG: formate dehydrogenase accessory sulfurtransferase FdhD [Rhodospirillales bacterium]|nr:formate dehydrogenase accessory sulfurtransferase FdhD [Rhodospirillales bacterium]MCW8970739.1 formate dehydrogenase accessory sulfurtransferase FdhD [Rhodospirillales bacterium]MCW9001332.1 formate dehydrogenase accessory sulfurtransferase FdhD [Rhodospirillales bacterium]MCW9039398.1 formate dehydrogenase accessory sulfurtransferase FdhD [Rhodospirillales bacterium]
MENKQPFLIHPDPSDSRLTRRVSGLDHDGNAVEVSVVTERPITLFLNGQEIVTMMTIGDFPEFLAVGYLVNQNMLAPDNPVTAVEFDDDLGVAVVRTERKTDFEEKLRKKTMTSGCAQGTLFGDVMEKFAEIELSPSAELRTSWLYPLLKAINTTPSLYLEAGAIHGCVLCCRDEPLLYMEDVGRHNAVDKIAGYMFLNKMQGEDKIMYTTGRLTSEMVLKTVQMRIPILVSRSGFTAWGVDLARQAGMTLVGRAKGRRFTVLAGQERMVFDADKDGGEETEPEALTRKGAKP